MSLCTISGFPFHKALKLMEDVMDKLTSGDWRTLYATALEGEIGQFETSIEGAEIAILERLREVVGSCSPSEESELYAALRKLQRVKAQLLAAA